jgi:6-phosphogluconolactonase
MPDLYAAVGPELHRYELDVEAVELTHQDCLPMPARVQYGWRHGTLPVLYVACADREPDATGDKFFLCPVLRRPSGLSLLQRPVVLDSRPIHVTVDADSSHLIAVYNDPPQLSVHEIRPDGSLGARLPPDGPLDLGVYPHHARVTPSNDRLIVVSRGWAADPQRAAVPGRLDVLSYRNGAVAPLQTIDVAGRRGVGDFNPRHVDCHPTQPLLFVALEPQSQLVTLRLDQDGVHDEPVSVTGLLAAPDDARPRQLAGAVHVHPSGSHVFVSNRADSVAAKSGGKRGYGWVTPEVLPIFAGGENGIAVLEIDRETGRTTRVQNVGTRGFNPRTFALDVTGRLLVAANMKPMAVPDGDHVRDVAASLAAFRFTGTGLEFVRTWEVDVGRETMEWMTICDRDL